MSSSATRGDTHAAPRPGLYVISAPSGAGKTSLVKALLERYKEARWSISYTTRPQRPSEEHGKDYFFVDEPTFREMLAADAFLEHAQVFDNYYGTSRDQVAGLIEQGHPVILEIDWQGARQVRAARPDCTTVFVLPPSRPELERRLRGRGTDAEAVILRRLADAVSDMSHWDEFDHVVINDNFDAALAELAAIVSGSGTDTLRDRQGLDAIVAGLLGKAAD